LDRRRDFWHKSEMICILSILGWSRIYIYEDKTTKAAVRFSDFGVPLCLFFANLSINAMETTPRSGSIAVQV
jgi:hypothetical protein